MKIVLLKEAIDNLADIEFYIAQDSSERARDFRKTLLKKANEILKNPLIGRLVPEFNHPQIRELFFKNYRIVYRINDDMIEILTVFEAHRLL